MKATRTNINDDANANAKTSAQQQPTSKPPLLETLEGRRLMSAVNLVDGMLILEGKAQGFNRITVSPDANGTTLFARANDVKAHYNVKDVKSIRIIGGAKDDQIVIDAAVRQAAYVNAKCGNDSVVAGSGNDTVIGGNGDDTLRGAAGDDMLLGQAGRDRVDAGPGDNPLKIAPAANKAFGISVASFTLVDASTKKTIGTISDGATLNLAKLPKKVTILANLSAANGGGSVGFTFDGAHVRNENAAPYALIGDLNGKLNGWAPKAGLHALTATPFSSKNGTGRVGTSKTITFSVVNDAARSGSGLVNKGTTPTKPTNPTTPPPPVVTPPPTTNPTTPPPVVTNPTTPPPTNTVDSPTVVITAMDSSVTLGHAVHVNGVKTTLKTGDWLGAKFEWDFGDPTAKYNKLTGFNAAHIYDKPGTYTVTLTVTNSAGKVGQAKTNVTVAAATRRYVYVSPTGNDANTGASTSAAVKTWARASQLAGDNTEILFQRGATFDVPSTMPIGFNNLVVGAYGTGNKPVLKWTGGFDYGTIFGTIDGNDVTVRDLAFDSKYTTLSEVGYNDAIRMGGKNITVRGCSFLNVGYAINSNGWPEGVLVQDNDCPNLKGLRTYFAWVQGSDHVYLGNKVLDSYQSHVLRLAGGDRILIAHNDLRNDPNTFGVRGVLTLHSGTHVHVNNNKLADSPIGMGPLDQGAGLDHKESRLLYTVIENNILDESQVNVRHGTEHAAIRNNVIMRDNANAIDVVGWSDQYARGTKDIYIVNNTAINNATGGKFLKV
jgi:PKD repeat protein